MEIGKKIYYLTSEPWPGTNTTVFVFDTETKTSSASALITGENFYGIGFNPASNLIYVGDSKAFSLGLDKLISTIRMELLLTRK